MRHRAGQLVLLAALAAPVAAQDVRPDPSPAVVTSTSAAPGFRREPEPWWHSWLTPQGLLVLLSAVPVLLALRERLRARDYQGAAELGGTAVGSMVTALHKARGRLTPEAGAVLVEELRRHSVAAGVEPVLRPIVEQLATPSSNDLQAELRDAAAAAKAELRKDTKRLDPPAAPPSPVV